MKNVLTIAGSDSSGGAGIQTDLKTFAACGVYGMSVITAITAQNTMGVNYVENVSKKMVKEQIKAIFEDIKVDSVKIGMLSSCEIIEVVCEYLTKYNAKNIVLDPVMVSTSGCDLISDSAKEILVSKLMKLADVITPNLSETKCILDILSPNEIKEIKSREDMVNAGKVIAEKTDKNILIKGGHLESKPCDVLVKKNLEVLFYENERIDTKNTHGTGCTLSSAIASNLAKGHSIEKSVEISKKFITEAIKNSLDIGHGSGPTNPMGEIYKKLDSYSVVNRFYVTNNK